MNVFQQALPDAGAISWRKVLASTKSWCRDVGECLPLDVGPSKNETWDVHTLRHTKQKPKHGIGPNARFNLMMDLLAIGDDKVCWTRG
jgi:hypothetical protein